MKIETTRFGAVEVPESELIEFSSGIIGFPAAKGYVLIPHATSTIIGWLQSTTEPSLAFPVVSAHGFLTDYPDVSLENIARTANLGDNVEELAVLVVLSAQRRQPATVNLLAPLLVNSRTRGGAQVFLEGSRYSTRELFIVPEHVTRQGDDEEPQAQAAAM
jgi:flagellar assembly factor FliW